MRRREKGASVEGELGRITGEEDGTVVDSAEGMFAVPGECRQYVRETGVDCLAPAIGSVHGLYRGEPDLQFDLMVQVREQTGAAGTARRYGHTGSRDPKSHCSGNLQDQCQHRESSDFYGCDSKITGRKTGSVSSPSIYGRPQKR